MRRDLLPALNLIREFEGLYLKAYKCPAGVPTIGYGTIRYPGGTPVKMGDTCSEAEASEWLLYEVNKFAKDVENLVLVSLTNNEFCALVSFCYNVGSDIDSDNLAEGLGDSTLLKKLNSGAPRASVAREFGKWVKAGGRTLKGRVRRREAEKALFLS